MIDDKIISLCKEYTSLTQADVSELLKEAKKVVELDHFKDEDVFIDVISDVTDEAIVVFHRTPKTNPSIYQEGVVGKIAKRINEPGVYRTFETALITDGLLARTQENQLIRQRVYPIRNNKQTIGVLIAEHAVHDMNQEQVSSKAPTGNAADILNSSKYSAYYRTLIDSLDEAILIFDESGHLVLNNEVASSYYYHFGYMENILGFHYDNLSLDTTTFEQLIYLNEANKWSDIEETFITFGHSYFKMKRFFDKQSGLLTMVLHDKTEIYNQENEIVEKSVAIKEIHHRVKNNLQSVVSLLRIQSRRSDNEEVKVLLAESEARVLAISTTHDLLSKQVDDDIPLYSVLDQTIVNAQRTFLGQKKIHVEKNIDQKIYLSSDKAVSVALIVNELLQNSFKHAFQDHDTDNKILIVVKMMNDHVLEVLIQDNGAGYDVHQTTRGSLGLTIVDSYVKDKLRGRLDILSDENGTTTAFYFKK